MRINKKILTPIFVTIASLLVLSTLVKEVEAVDRPNPKFEVFGFVSAESDSKIQFSKSSPQRVHPVRIHGTIDLAGEVVPLHDMEIRERFDRELLVNTFWHSNTMFNYKLANKYFRDIEKILAQNGIPSDFKYLAVAESGLRNVVSYAGAAGFWQFLKSTGIEYGLVINDQVDERYNYEKATLAACKYLKEAYNKFGSWTLAAASYNVGMGKLNKRLNEQKATNYYDLYLNDETSRYIFRILAYKVLFENPEKFGYFFEKDDLYNPYEVREFYIDQSIEDLAQFAIDNGTTYKMLRVVNPWLRGSKLSVGEGNNYIVKIPFNYDEANFIDPSEVIEEGKIESPSNTSNQEIITPTTSSE